MRCITLARLMQLSARFRALFFLFLLGVAVSINAQDASGLERAEFKRLYEAASEGKAAEADFAGLSQYVLFPYLIAARLSWLNEREPGLETDQQIAEFLARNPRLGATPALRSRWLDSLARQENWATLLANIPDDTQNLTLRCRRLHAKLALGIEEGRAEEARELWRSAKPLPADCQPVFEWLKESGELTPALLEERTQLAQNAGELDLVQSLAQWQSGAAQARTERWLRLMREPEAELERLAEQPDPEFDSSALLQALQRLARRDPDAAAELQPQLAQSGAFTAAESAQAAAYIGYSYMLSREPESFDWFTRAGTAQLDAKLRDWRVRTALFARDWQAVRSWIALMPPAEREDERWRYWDARAALELGGRRRKTAAEHVLAELAQRRSYYGYLAADRLHRPYRLNHRSSADDSEAQSRIAQDLAARRARELWLLDYPSEARAEWQQLVKRLQPAELEQAALLAHHWGWHSSAILSLQSAGNWDDLDLRFPLPYRDSIENLARTRRLDPAWVYGLMRTESLFMRDARSPANAWGLMQLLPATGQRSARRLGIAWDGIETLKLAEPNIRLGTAYLEEMRDKFGGNAALATAAYNAGPNPVLRWLPQTPTEGELWVEIIPYNETHKYVKSVLEYATTFEWRLTGKTSRLTQRLGTIPPQDQLPD
ncbi:MAG: transglycosylase SLT domain-containing protein [Nevskiales bacterium]